MCVGKRLSTVITVAHICVRVITTSITVSVHVVFSKETVLGLQQVELPSHLKNSEQASCADEQLHLCEEHGLSLLQLQLINLSISEGATSTLLGSDTGQYAPDRPFGCPSKLKWIQLWWILLQCSFPNANL